MVAVLKWVRASGAAVGLVTASVTSRFEVAFVGLVVGDQVMAVSSVVMRIRL